jgi:hypothetical protein
VAKELYSNRDLCDESVAFENHPAVGGDPAVCDFLGYRSFFCPKRALGALFSKRLSYIKRKRRA